MTTSAEERKERAARSIICALGLPARPGLAGELAWALTTVPLLDRPWETALFIRPDDARMVLRSPLAGELRRRGLSAIAEQMSTVPGDVLLVVAWLGTKAPRVGTLSVEAMRIKPSAPGPRITGGTIP